MLQSYIRQLGLTAVSQKPSENSVTTTDEESLGQSRTTNDTPESSESDETNSTTPANTDRLPKDLIFGILSNERRRQVLTHLNENGSSTVLSDLAEQIASNENNKPVSAISSKERKRVYVGLYQVHLPKMDDANVIDYNQARGTVELRPEANQLLTYLEVDPHSTDRISSWFRRLI